MLMLRAHRPIALASSRKNQRLNPSRRTPTDIFPGQLTLTYSLDNDKQEVGQFQVGDKETNNQVG